MRDVARMDNRELEGVGSAQSSYIVATLKLMFPLDLRQRYLTLSAYAMTKHLDLPCFTFSTLLLVVRRNQTS